MPNPLRIPTWLVGLSIVVIVGALVRVTAVQGAAGATAFLFKLFVPLVLFFYNAVASQGLQERGLGKLWPGARRLFIGCLVVIDVCCAAALIVGGPFIGIFGI